MHVARWSSFAMLVVLYSGCRLLGQDIPCEENADCPTSLPICEQQICVAGSVGDAGAKDVGRADRVAMVDIAVVDTAGADGAPGQDAGDGAVGMDGAADVDQGAEDAATGPEDGGGVDVLVPDANGGAVDVGNEDVGSADAAGVDVGSADASGEDSGQSADAGPYQVQRCAEISIDAGSEPCVVTGSGDEVVIIGDLLLPDRVLENGGVAYNSQGAITCVGCGCTASRQVYCPNAAVSPGLIDGRTHIDWGNSEPVNPDTQGIDIAVRYEHRHGWRRGNLPDDPKLQTPSPVSTDQYKIWAELRWALNGTTSANSSGGGTGLVRNLDVDSLVVEDGSPRVDFETFPLGDTGGQTVTQGCAYPRFPTPAVGRHFAAVVATGVNQAARSELLCLTGTGGTGSQDILTGPATLMSAVALDAADAQMMANRGLSLIWTPRSDVSLYGNTSPIPLLRRMGVEIGLGSDWPVTGSRTLLDELKCAQHLSDNQYNNTLDHRELWRMVTFGAAAALGIDDAVGVLRVGLQADIAVFTSPTVRNYQTVVEAGPSNVALVVIDGKVVSGRAAAVDALTTGCDSYDMCGQSYKLCLDTTGFRYVTLENTAQSDGFPSLVECDGHNYQRSCVPARTRPVDVPTVGGVVYTGIPKGGDTDGDGIPEGQDNCPLLFNPVRHMDYEAGNAQADSDNDGLGDLCDPCPTTGPDDDCTLRNRDDRDGDTRLNWEDNCPDVANIGQIDTDNDGWGEQCDPCRYIYNAGGLNCTSTIYELHTEPLLMDLEVHVPGVVVTVVAPTGFFVQHDPDDTEVYIGPEHSGMFVYTQDPPAVAVRDIIDITSATLVTYFGLIELKDAIWSVTGERPLEISPLDLTLVDIAAQSAQGSSATLIGVLVSISGASVISIDSGNSNFVIEHSVVVDNGIYASMPLAPASTSLTTLRGPLTWAYDSLTVLPRDGADLVY